MAKRFLDICIDATDIKELDICGAVDDQISHLDTVKELIDFIDSLIDNEKKDEQ